MKIAIELDGPVVDFHGGFAATYNKWFGANIETPQTAEFWAGTRFESATDAYAWLEVVPFFWSSLEATPGAIGALWELGKEGHQLSLTSTRPAWARAESAAWRMHTLALSSRLRLPSVHVFSPSSKTMLDSQVYIEGDSVEVRSLQDKPCVLVFDQPWNRDVKASKNVHRVRGWAEALKFIERLGMDQ